MADRQRVEGIDISAILGVLRRRLLLIVLTVAIAGAAAYFLSDRQTREYSAAAKLLLQGTVPGQPGSQFSSPLPQGASDRETLVLSPLVEKRVEARLARRVGEPQAKNLVSKLSASSEQDSNVVQLTATASSPRVAAFAANTLAAQNIAFRRGTALRKIRRAQRNAQRQLTALGPGRVNTVKAGTVSQLQEQLASLRSEAAAQDGDALIVARAVPPTSASSPKPKRNALIGAFGGLLLGLALAVVMEQVDRRVRYPKELEEAFGLPVLANVPKTRALAKNGKALEQLPSREAESFQILRANLRYLSTDRELRSVVVTSTGVGDGKSTVALNLAKADASTGKKALLVEADVRRPHLNELLGLDVKEGLTSYLSDPSVRLADVTYQIPVVHRRNGPDSTLTMDVIVAGPAPANPREVIHSERIRELVEEAEARYDLVVIDTSPAAVVADPIPLMMQATAVVIVGRVGKITADEAEGLRQQLERIDAPAFGLVANFSSGSGKYGYGYY
jgi:tyrosine-protein kinase